MTAPVLAVDDLSVGFEDEARPVLDGVSLEISGDGWTGLVGESGSGKTLTALSLLGLLPSGARVLGGRVLMDGEDLLALPPEQMRRFRGTRIGMIFQSPRSALNPLMTAGGQIARAVRRRNDGAHAEREALELLRRVRIPDPELRAAAYPHQLSGGMCQRVLIAMMLAVRPRLLIADEPTTGLDVTVQSEILDLVQALQEETGMAVLLISHDLGIVAEHCRRVAVMLGGRVVETAPAEALFGEPRHPYTAELMATLLRADRPVDVALAGVAGRTGRATGSGCVYTARCHHAEPACEAQAVRLEAAGPGHVVACRRHRELAPLSVAQKAGMARTETRL